MGTRGTAVVVTVWRDFGEILTPFDLTWRSHFHYFPTFPVTGTRSARRLPKTVTPSPEDSLKNSFEGGGLFQFDAQQTKSDVAWLYIKKFKDSSTCAIKEVKDSRTCSIM